MAKTDNAPRNCPGCGDKFTPDRATVSWYDNRTPVCSACGTFEMAARGVGDRLVSPGNAVRKDRPDRDHFNRRTAYLRDQ